MKLEIRKTDNYIDKKMPVDIIKMAAEMIDHVVTKKNEKTNLTEFVNQKLSELNTLIKEDDGWPKIDKDFTQVFLNS